MCLIRSENMYQILPDWTILRYGEEYTVVIVITQVYVSRLYNIWFMTKSNNISGTRARYELYGFVLMLIFSKGGTSCTWGTWKMKSSGQLAVQVRGPNNIFLKCIIWDYMHVFCPLLVKIDFLKILKIKSLIYQLPPSGFNKLIRLNCDKNQPLTVTSLLVLSKKWSLLTN
jgi:hypothetical protein